MNYCSIFTVRRYRLYLILFICLSVLFSFTYRLAYPHYRASMHTEYFESRWNNDGLCIEIGALLFLFPLAVSLYRKNESIDSDDRTVFFSVWAVQLLYVFSMDLSSIFAAVMTEYNIILLIWIVLFLLPLWYIALYLRTCSFESHISYRAILKVFFKILSMYILSTLCFYLTDILDFHHVLFFGNEYYLLAHSPVKDFLLFASSNMLVDSLLWLPLIIIAVYLKNFKKGITLTAPIIFITFLCSHVITKYFWKIWSFSYWSMVYCGNTHYALLVLPVLWYALMKLSNSILLKTISILMIVCLFTASLWIFQFIFLDNLIRINGSPISIEQHLFPAFAIPESLLFPGHRSELLSESVTMNSEFMVKFLLKFDIDQYSIKSALMDAGYNNYVDENIQTLLEEAYHPEH